jgi:hypothetical protein
MGHRPFLVLADYLTRHGTAVLRFDDRRFAKSTGNFSTSTHEDFAADALAAFKFLRRQDGIDPARVGLCGHSEGAIHAAIAAAADHDVDFVVMLAGVGVPMEQLLVRQRRDVLRSMGVDEAGSAEMKDLNEKIFARLRAAKTPEEARKEVRTLLEQTASHYTPEQRVNLGLTNSSIDQQVAMLTSRWFLKLLAYDPAATLAEVRCPVLALNGEKDLQVAFQENLKGIRRGLEAGGNKDVTTHALPDLNHLFQHCQTGAVFEYGQIEETMSPEVLRLVSDWIKKHTAPGGEKDAAGVAPAG